MLEEEQGEDGEALTLRDCLIASESGDVELDCHVGVLLLQGKPSASCIGVAEIDGRFLCAFPEQVWHKKPAKRSFPNGTLSKAVAVIVPSCPQDNRELADLDSTMKVWLGLISPEVADLVDFSVGVEPDIAFPVDSQGIQLLPFAESLVAAARDHFTFLSYSEGGAQGKGGHVEGRLQSLEEGLSKLQATLEAALGSQGPAAAGSKKTKPAAPAKTRKSVETPPGLDPVVAQHALQSGVSQDALAELAQLQVAGKGHAGGKKTAAVLEEVSSEDGDLEEDGDPDAGSADPVARAVTQMSKVLREMHRDRKEKKAKTWTQSWIAPNLGRARTP